MFVNSYVRWMGAPSSGARLASLRLARSYPSIVYFVLASLELVSNGHLPASRGPRVATPARGRPHPSNTSPATYLQSPLSAVQTLKVSRILGHLKRFRGYFAQDVPGNGTSCTLGSENTHNMLGEHSFFLVYLCQRL